MRFVPGGWVSGGVGLGAAVTLALAGCTGDPAPIVTELPSASPSADISTATPSPSPSATPLTDDEVLALLPDGAERADVWGAMVTAQFFLEQYAPMFQTGDTRLWQALSADGCEYCADALENAVRVRDEGWTARGGGIIVDSGKTQAALTSDTEASVLIAAELAAGILEVPGEEPATTSEAGTVEFGLRLVNDGRVWRVVGASSQDSS